MRSNKGKRLTIVLVLVLALGMIIPQHVSAASETSKKAKATNVQYVTDSSGSKIGVKSFTISPFTYSNISQNRVVNPDGQSTIKLDDAALLRIAKEEIFPKWGVIAEGIFRDQANQLVTIEGSGMMSSDISSKNSFDRHFSTGKVSNGYSYDWSVKDLAAYLGSSESKHQGKICWDEVRVSGPTQIGSLNGARTLMGQELRNCSDDNDVTRDDFLGNSYQKNEDMRRLPDLEDDKSGEGFANIVTCVNRAGASGDYDYVSFGIAVYGFDITPVAAENLKYIEAADDDYDLDGQKKSGQDILNGLAGNVNKTGISFHNDRENGTTTYIRNNTTQEVTQSSGLENSISEESSISTDETFEWGMEQEIGMELNMGGFGPGAMIDGTPAPCMFPRATLSMSNSWHELWSTTKSTSETKTSTKTKTTNTEVTLPGHTIAVVNQSLENTTTTENYQQPVIISYKVAVFAMSGDYFNGASGGITSSRYDKQWMSVIFDGSDDVHTSGCKALGSLYNRGVVNKDTQGYDGAKGKYRSWCDKSAWNSSDKINWNSISDTLRGDNRASHRIPLSTGIKATNVRDLATELPLLEKAQMLTSKRESITSSVDQIVPMYPLASVIMKSGSKQYELLPRGQQNSDESNVLHLDSIKVEGFDKDNADFYEFDQDWGKWELIGEEDEVIVDDSAEDEAPETGVIQSGLVRLVTDDVLDTQRIEVARDESGSPAEERHYIRWKLKKGTGEDGAKIISNESLNRPDEDGGPYMTDDEKDGVSTPSVEIIVKNRESDIVNFEVDGTYKGPWNEEINLGHILSASAVDQTGKIRGVPVYWEAKGESGISVDKSGKTTFTKKGTYKVRPYSYNIEDSKVIPKDSNGNPVWLELTAQDKSQLASIVMSKPDSDEADTELTEGTSSIGFDLTSYTKFYDQYGDKWEGDIKEIKDEKTGETVIRRVLPEMRYSVSPNNYAVVDAEGILTVTRAGTYTVNAKAYDENGNDTGIAIKSIRIEVTEKDRLASITFDEPGISRSERTLKTKDDFVTVKNLKNLISYIDQNGNEWNGKKPSISFSLGDAGDAAEIQGDSFFAYEPGRYTIRASASGYTIEPITITILEDSSLVLKSEDPGRQYLYSEEDQVEIELERYINALNTFGGKWKGNVPELDFTLDKAAEGTSITTRTVYENEDDYEGVDRHFFRTNVPGEYKIHVMPKKASEYTGDIDDINIRVVKGKRVARIEFADIENELGEDALAVNTYNSSYPQIDLKSHLKYYDGFGEEIDPTKDHVKIPDCRFELLESDTYDAGGYDFNNGVLSSYQPDTYFVRASINATNNDPNDENADEDIILEDITSITTYDIEWIHNFGDWETETQATCTEDANRVKRCQGHDTDGDGEIDEECSVEISEYVPATGHDWAGDDGVAGYEVIEEGSLKYVAVRCQKCGEINEDTITKDSYGFSTWEEYKPIYKDGYEATCTKPGIMLFWHRTTTGYMEQTEVKVPATGHSWSDNYVEKEPATCSKTGLEVIKCKCNGCEAEQEDSAYQRVIPKKAHIPDEGAWVYDKDSEGNEEKETCEEFGWQVTTCTECEEKMYRLVEPKKHDWDEGKVTTEPACEKDGVMTYTCRNDASHIRTEAVPATGHEWDSGKITKKATCSQAGVKTYTCKHDAAHTRTESIAAIGHKWGAWKKLNDSQHQRVCSNDSMHVQKANHTWDKGKVTKKATTTKTGVRTHTCTACKATKTTTIAKLPKKANPLKIKAKTAVVKYAKVKKKAQNLSFKKVVSITKKGKGKLSYAKASGNKKITINKKTGKVTVKKGLKKGTYKVKVKVKAAGNADYKAVTKTVTFKIRVR